MPTASESATTHVPARDDELHDELHDDLGERMHAMSECSPKDAATFLKMVVDPAPISDNAKAVHEAGLARFAARFQITD